MLVWFVGELPNSRITHGIASANLLLISQLNTNGFEVKVFCEDPYYSRTLFARTLLKISNFTYLLLKLLVHSLISCLPLSARPQISYVVLSLGKCGLLKTLLYILLSRRSRLLYLHIHRSDAFLRRDAFDLLLLRLIFYFADRIFTLSEDIFLLANGSSFNHLRHKFFYLPNTLDPHYEALAESFNVSDAELSPKPLLFFSNIQKTKGIDTFLNLHARVAPRGFCSVVCGSIIDSDYLHSIERPSLIYLGPIFSDARKLEIFSQSSCLILPRKMRVFHLLY